MHHHARLRRHHIACGLNLDDGEVILTMNVVSNYGPGSLCAEQIALGRYLLSASVNVKLVATLRSTFGPQAAELVSPCGHCRELLYEYAPDCMIITLDHNSDEATWFRMSPIKTLIPKPFVRRGNSQATDTVAGVFFERGVVNRWIQAE